MRRTSANCVPLSRNARGSCGSSLSVPMERFPPAWRAQPKPFEDVRKRPRTPEGTRSHRIASRSAASAGRGGTTSTRSAPTLRQPNPDYGPGPGRRAAATMRRRPPLDLRGTKQTAHPLPKQSSPPHRVPAIVSHGLRRRCDHSVAATLISTSAPTMMGEEDGRTPNGGPPSRSRRWTVDSRLLDFANSRRALQGESGTTGRLHMVNRSARSSSHLPPPVVGAESMSRGDRSSRFDWNGDRRVELCDAIKFTPAGDRLPCRAARMGAAGSSAVSTTG